MTAASTTATTIQVQVSAADFGLSVPSGSPTSATVSPGGTATYALAVAPSSGSTFPSAVALTVSGLPAGATATFTPPTLAAGAGSTNVALAVRVAQQTASLPHGTLLALKSSSFMLGILLLPFGGTLRRLAQRHQRKLRLLLLVVAGLLPEPRRLDSPGVALATANSPADRKRTTQSQSQLLPGPCLTPPPLT